MKINYSEYLIDKVLIRKLVYRILNLIVILVALNFTIDLILFKFEKKFNEKYTTQQLKFYYKGLIVNPVSLIATAKIYEKNGKYEKAIEDLQLAEFLCIHDSKYFDYLKLVRDKIRYLEVMANLESKETK